MDSLPSNLKTHARTVLIPLKVAEADYKKNMHLKFAAERLFDFNLLVHCDAKHIMLKVRSTRLICSSLFAMYVAAVIKKQKRKKRKQQSLEFRRGFCLYNKMFHSLTRRWIFNLADEVMLSLRFRVAVKFQYMKFRTMF